VYSNGRFKIVCANWNRYKAVFANVNYTDRFYFNNNDEYLYHYSHTQRKLWKVKLPELEVVEVFSAYDPYGVVPSNITVGCETDEIAFWHRYVPRIYYAKPFGNSYRFITNAPMNYAGYVHTPKVEEWAKYKYLTDVGINTGNSSNQNMQSRFTLHENCRGQEIVSKPIPFRSNTMYGITASDKYIVSLITHTEIPIGASISDIGAVYSTKDDIPYLMEIRADQQTSGARISVEVTDLDTQKAVLSKTVEPTGNRLFTKVSYEEPSEEDSDGQFTVLRSQGLMETLHGATFSDFYGTASWSYYRFIPAVFDIGSDRARRIRINKFAPTAFIVALDKENVLHLFTTSTIYDKELTHIAIPMPNEQQYGRVCKVLILEADESKIVWLAETNRSKFFMFETPNVPDQELAPFTVLDKTAECN